MTRRLLFGYLSITVVVLLLLELPLAAFYAQRERDRLTSELERDANVIATIYEDSLERGLPLDPAAAIEYEARTDARVVITDSKGVARVDTEQPTPRDFSTRPEITVALTGRRSAGTRASETLGTEIVYVAIPIASSGTVHGTIRLTLDTSHINGHIHRFWLALAAIAGIVLAMMSLVGWVIARSVTRPLRRLTTTAARFADGDLRTDDDAAAPCDGPEELGELERTMSTMANRLSLLIDEQRAFVADASHQLRTPLTALRLRLENLQSHLVPSDATELDAAIDETSRLAGLVADLLQLARADRGSATVVVDLARIVDERLDTWSAVAESHGVVLRTQGTERPALVHSVPGGVEQILDNCLDNAVRASSRGGEVVVEIDARDGRYRLVVSDDGPGLSDDDKVRAVRRFWRGDNSTPGTGLGLAIATALAHTSGGELRLADHLPSGLQVVIELRRAGERTQASEKTVGRAVDTDSSSR